MPDKSKPPCECRALERMAEETDAPIRWDEVAGEYELIWDGGFGGEASMVFYHCPFCGGLLPESKRDRLFATITDQERSRLLKMACGIETLDAVIERFGPPDHDRPAGSQEATPEKEHQPPTVRAGRTLLYGALSETADVRFTDWGKPPISATLIGKYVGPTAN